ncbi:nucleoside triphosphate pyrophosphohydrolase [Angelakisella massiliensis]|uniref:nucleoside triphosphate pyrophosphohydrolase n=1 Tax=Angelakisella massiliensis TaxID=1871018 RepID=UPI0024B19223|nr:nucleoside triphosphate pyrophosphohydrolase [Angelakisella massiliensis]
MKVDFEIKDRYTIADLLRIMELLRSENGCPWDREQDHRSIRNNFIEETYEVVEAIDTGDKTLMEEELGDVLLQVVFHAQMEREQGSFDFDDVCDGICKKLIHRHPHIFGDVTAEDSGTVLRNWDAIKKEEKSQTTAASTLEGVSRALPALMRSCKVQKRAARTGFEYPDVRGALEDLKSEIAELEQAMDAADEENMMEELGDVLFSSVNVGRMLHLDPEEALYRSTDKFIRRFTAMEQLATDSNLRLEDCSIDKLNDIWKDAKKKV